MPNFEIDSPRSAFAQVLGMGSARSLERHYCEGRGIHGSRPGRLKDRRIVFHLIVALALLLVVIGFAMLRKVASFAAASASL